MKKIVAAAAAGLILAGTAFADVSFSWKRTNIVGGTSKALDSVERTDCLGLELSNDIAGVVFDWDIKENESKATSKLELDSYYGWMTFGLPVGNLQVTSGKWNGRYSDRVKSDAGDLDGKYYEAYKLGVINGVGAADSDNLTKGQMSTVLAYTLADTLPGTLLVKAGIVKCDYGKYDSQSGFVAEVGYRQEGLINVDVAIKNPSDKVTTIGAFVSPLMVENLRATVGFTMGNYDGDKEFAFDARARYAITEKTAVTGMFNYSSIAKELKASKSGDDLNAMWTMISVNHVAGDNIRFLATLQNTVLDFDADNGNNLTAFTPACEIQISEKALFTAAFDMRWDNKTPYAGVGDVSLPIYVTLSL
ncbi:hypothetical protein [uncultured Treponema sp.]|uniref:hypothetical protein n=1 Tax=uncultured Treponema sp. TaxID=162155 RepID=UPI00258E832B|nr:hypothetical protein [uncultured Treponema sp.]